MGDQEINRDSRDSEGQSYSPRVPPAWMSCVACIVIAVFALIAAVLFPIVARWHFSR